MLIDFPRNLNQAKMLENMFTGFQSHTDIPKPVDQQNNEVWAKVTDPVQKDFDGKFESQKSMFDQFIVINPTKEECSRRANNRKVDPTTNTVYHMEDSPPPEDPKLVERLVDYFGPYASKEDMDQKIDINHTQFMENEPTMLQYYTEFGHFDAPTGVGMPSLVKVSDGKAEDVTSTLEDAFSQLLKFKQIA